jgi:DNA-binding GntR family transcriptional regulator
VVTERALLRLQTYQAIRDGILSARYHPGVLLSEQQVAAGLQVSRTPVREAIKQLEHEGLGSLVPTRGIFVRETTARDVVEIFQMREALACFALRVASRTIPAETLRQLDALFARYQAADAILFAGDTALHAMIVAAAGNERMLKTLEPMRAQILRVLSLSWSTPGRVARACCKHRRIIQSLLQGDRDGAEAALRDHLRNGRNHLLRLLLYR